MDVNESAMDTTDDASTSRRVRDEFYENIVIETFWKKTDRKQKRHKKEVVVPEQFHCWGALYNIKNVSETLKNVLDRGGVNTVNNFRNTLENILNELNLEFKIEPVNTFKPCVSCVVYDIQSVPPFAFYGSGPSHESAIVAAARDGIVFFTTLSIE